MKIILSRAKKMKVDTDSTGTWSKIKTEKTKKFKKCKRKTEAIYAGNECCGVYTTD